MIKLQARLACQDIDGCKGPPQSICTATESKGNIGGRNSVVSANRLFDYYLPPIPIRIASQLLQKSVECHSRYGWRFPASCEGKGLCCRIYIGDGNRRVVSI